MLVKLHKIDWFAWISLSMKFIMLLIFFLSIGLLATA